MESNLPSHLVMPVGPVVAAFLTPVVQVMSGAAFLSTSDMRQAGPAVLPLTTAGHKPGVATGVLVEKSGGMLAEGSRQGHFFGFAFFTADFLAPFFALLFPLPMSALAAW